MIYLLLKDELHYCLLIAELIVNTFKKLFRV